MLSELYIENLAVIQKAVIPFNDNLNIFTGETGAGKSILINGINAILGQRITKDIVRTGCEKALITAFFKNISQSSIDILNKLGFDCEDGQITVSREISADGGSVSRINCRACTVSALKELGDTLINIHGQHDSQTLLSPEKHIEILDSFGGLNELLNDYRTSFKKLQELARSINKMTIDEAEKNRRIAELNANIEEIGALELEEDEDVSVEEEYKAAKNIDRILKSLYSSKEILNGDNDENIISMLDNAIYSINQISDVIPETAELIKRLESSKIELSDIYEEMSDLSDRQEINSERFEYITSRRDELIHIKRKYGPELSDVIKLYNNSLTELNQLQSSSENIDKLKKEKQQHLAEVTEKAKKLSNEREEAAKRFTKQVSDELEFLNMPNVILDVNHQKGKLTINGMDTVEFMISANIGEPSKPIAKIASGGELSRIMLALKNVIADKDDIPTLIFDEIDTGVSGRAAQKIGIKLGQIGKIRQVICVTHLAQIAVMADNHLFIEKNVIDDRTVTTVKQLDFDEKVKEIARIIGGNNITELTLKNAEEMLNLKNRQE